MGFDLAGEFSSQEYNSWNGRNGLILKEAEEEILISNTNIQCFSEEGGEAVAEAME